MSSNERLRFAYEANMRIRVRRATPLILVGIRTVDELDVIREFWPVFVVALDASAKVRKRRWDRRQVETESPALHSWEERDAVERSWGLDDLLKGVDITLDAEQPVDNIVEETLEHWDSVSRIEV